MTVQTNYKGSISESFDKSIASGDFKTINLDFSSALVIPSESELINGDFSSIAKCSSMLRRIKLSLENFRSSQDAPKPVNFKHFTVTHNYLFEHRKSIEEKRSSLIWEYRQQ